MTRQRITRIVLAAVLPLALWNCSKQEVEPVVKKLEPVVIVDDFRNLSDGAQVAFKLTAGTYKVELTSGNGTATVEWVGAPCAKSGEVTTLQTMCELAQDGQILVTNPTNFGNGPAITVTIKVTRMPPVS